jgi:hypothetical protein
METIWGGIIAVIVLSIISNIFTTPDTTPLDQLYVICWIITYHIPLFFVAGGLLLLTAVSWIGSREHKVRSSLSLEQQNRVNIYNTLHKAYAIELAGSLQSLARIPLRLHERFDLTHPARPEQPERELPEGTTIVDAYNQAGNGLLILGEPGAGKSTLLYDLAQALLSQAKQNEEHLEQLLAYARFAGLLLSQAKQNEKPRLPVILNLSSWATKRCGLEEWLLEELSLHYGIPQHLGQQVEFLPLLDGLDEVDESARDACIEAINKYHSDHFVPLVVCSRREAYQKASKQLTLQSAVIVQPLSFEQVKAYLADAGETLAAVQTAINTNLTLQELLTTPLMLSVVTQTYKDKAVKDLPRLGSAEEQQRQVFTHYVTRTLERRAKKRHYTTCETWKWLIWLAQQMQQHHLTEFYLERLQGSWLPTKKAQQLYPWLSGVFYGVLFGVLFGVLVKGVFAKRLIGLFYGPEGLLFKLGGGPLFGLLYGAHEPLRGLLRLGAWPLYGPGGLLYGLLAGLSAGLGVGLLILRTSTDIQPTERLRRSLSQLWKRQPRAVVAWLLVGLGFALFSGLFLWLLYGLGGLLYGLGVGLLIGLRYGLREGLGVGLDEGLNEGLDEPLRLFFKQSEAQFDEHMSLNPNQGIHNSGWNALLLGVIDGLVIGLLFGLFLWLVFGLILYGLVFGLISGLVGALTVGLIFGGATFLSHYTLRLLLWQYRVMPLHYVRFLGEATECLLLQRVGGGYRFIHPEFQKYFASLETGTSASTQSQPSSPQP